MALIYSDLGFTLMAVLMAVKVVLPQNAGLASSEARRLFDNSKTLAAPVFRGQVQPPKMTLVSTPRVRSLSDVACAQGDSGASRGIDRL
jgi:hypothetical protein